MSKQDMTRDRSMYVCRIYASGTRRNKGMRSPSEEIDVCRVFGLRPCQYTDVSNQRCIHPYDDTMENGDLRQSEFKPCQPKHTQKHMKTSLH